VLRPTLAFDSDLAAHSIRQQPRTGAGMAGETRYGIDIRRAVPADAADSARLLGELGYPMTAREAAERLERSLRQADGTVLVATDWDGSVIGLVAVQWCAMLQQPHPVARIQTMVVDAAQARRGIGRVLVKAAAQAARTAGCDVLELTTGLQREAAHAFYRAIGFSETAKRFSRSLRKRNP
jgi:GNAT superfamily N-acetyltransferase